MSSIIVKILIVINVTKTLITKLIEIIEGDKEIVEKKADHVKFGEASQDIMEQVDERNDSAALRKLQQRRKNHSSPRSQM